MSQQREERAGEAVPAEPKTEWTRPEVEKLIAGGAEGSADLATDGIDIPS